MRAALENVKDIITQIETEHKTEKTGKKTMDEVIGLFLKDSASTDSAGDGSVSESRESYFDMEELKHWKEQMNQTYEIHYNREIICFRKYFRRPAIFLKRLVRKLCRSLIQPMVEEQNTFNANATASVNSLFNNEIVTEIVIAETENKLNYLTERIASLECGYKDAQQDTSEEDVRAQITPIIETLLAKEKQLGQKNAEETAKQMIKEITKEYQEYVEQEINTCQKIVSEQIRSHETVLQHKYEQILAETEWRHTQEEMKLFRNTRQNLGKEHIGMELAESKPEEPIDIYGEIDYFDFENHFRGSCQDIKNRQAIYIPYFMNKHMVLDLGCGRGEFLELLKENGITSLGIDHYEEFADYCRAKDLNAIYADAIQYLSSQKDNSLGGIFAAQLIEHLSKDHLIFLCHLAYEKLEQGSFLIMETPNPMCLSIYTNSFYIDPSHQKPIHPKMMEYLLKREGFRTVEILYTEQSKSGYRLPLLKSDDIENLSEFNKGIDVLSDLLFGSEDYAMIAQK